MYVYHVSLVSRPPSMGLKRVTQKNLSQHSFKRPRKLLGCWQILPKTHHLQLIWRAPYWKKKQMVILLITWACMVFFWHQGTKDHVGLTSIASNPELIELRVRAWKWMVGIQVSSWDGLIFSGVIRECNFKIPSVVHTNHLPFWKCWSSFSEMHFSIFFQHVEEVTKTHWHGHIWIWGVTPWPQGESPYCCVWTTSIWGGRYVQKYDLVIQLMLQKNRP